MALSERRSAARPGSRDFERTGGVLEFGELLGRRHGRERREAARREPEPPLAAVLDDVERPERRLDRVAHPLGGAPRHFDRFRHLVERETLCGSGEFAREREDGEGLGKAHRNRPGAELTQHALGN